MIVAIFLSLIIGSGAGYYARTISDKLTQLYAEMIDRREARQVGVVRPIGISATRNQPIDLTTDTGGIRKPSPAEIENQRQEDRARILREAHR